jgi:hypothetical protein
MDVSQSWSMVQFFAQVGSQMPAPFPPLLLPPGPLLLPEHPPTERTAAITLTRSTQQAFEMFISNPLRCILSTDSRAR